MFNAKKVVDQYNNFLYVVTQSPNMTNIEHYKNMLLKNNVNTVVRLCDQKSYDDEYLNTHGINVIHSPLKDGDVPDINSVNQWKQYIKQEMKNKKTIAVHCTAGLGRAPLFVCIGLILVGKENAMDAINTVRNKIKGALNNRQIQFLCNELYEIVNINNTNKCIVM